MDACSGAYSSCHQYCDKALIYNHLQWAKLNAGSSLGGVAAEGRVREWGEVCHYVLFDAAIGGYNQQMHRNFVCLGTNMVHVKLMGETIEPTPMQLYLAAGESTTSGQIFMDNLRTIMHGLPVDVPIMVCEDLHAMLLQQTQLQRTVDDLSQKRFPASIDS